MHPAQTSKLDQILDELPETEAERLLQALHAKGRVGAKALAKLLSAHGHEVSPTSIIRWRGRNL